MRQIQGASEHVLEGASEHVLEGILAAHALVDPNYLRI
jgi:hypothetical protein